MYFPIISPALVALCLIVLASAITRARDLQERAVSARPGETSSAVQAPDTAPATGGVRAGDEGFFEAVSTLHAQVGAGASPIPHE